MVPLLDPPLLLERGCEEAEVRESPGGLGVGEGDGVRVGEVLLDVDEFPDRGLFFKSTFCTKNNNNNNTHSMTSISIFEPRGPFCSLSHVCVPYPSTRMDVGADQTGGGVDVREADGPGCGGRGGGQLGLVLVLVLSLVLGRGLGRAALLLGGLDLGIHQPRRRLLPLRCDLRQDAVCTAPWWWW